MSSIGKTGGTASAGFNAPSELSDSPVATVQLGESKLLEVAQRLGTDLDSLLQANPQISNPTKLMVGQEIRLPLCQAPQTPAEIAFGREQVPSRSASPSDPSRLVSSDPMAKTMIQLRLHEGVQQTGSPASVTGRPVFGAATKAQRHEQWLGELARDPGEAHHAWKNLSDADRLGVETNMEARYGKPFTQQFLAEVKKRKPQIEMRNYQPGTGPSPDELTAKGYRLGWKVRGNAGVEVENWVHPSGRSIQRDVSTWKPGAAQPEEQSKGEAGEVQSVDPPPSVVDPLVDKQDKAEVLLSRLQDNNNQIRDLLNSHPVPWDEVKQKFMRSNDLQAELKELGASSDDPAAAPTLDMSDVDENFYEELDAAKQDLLDLRVDSDKQNPDFETLMQQPSRD